MTRAVRTWLRRVLRRPPTIADCLRAAHVAPCEPLRAPDPVMRAATNRAAHYRALGEDPDADWGPWVGPNGEAA